MSGVFQQPHSHLLRSDVKARRASFIVPSYIVVRSPEGQRVAPANDGLSDRDLSGQRCTNHPRCHTGAAEANQTRQVETMLVTADGLRLTAYGPDEDEMRIAEDLPKAKQPLDG